MTASYKLIVSPLFSSDEDVNLRDVASSLTVIRQRSLLTGRPPAPVPRFTGKRARLTREYIYVIR